VGRGQRPPHEWSRDAAEPEGDDLTPRFSVVVPTRDRPDLLAYCLESLVEQTFDDIEVIVADNPLQRPARGVFERWARPGWKYLRANEPLAMHDNWERAWRATTGEYVTFLIDKTFLHPSALELADGAAAAQTQIDMVTWWNESYYPLDERRRLGRGRYLPTATPVPMAPYDPAAELAQLYEYDARRGSDPIHYCRGKIVFGVYSRALLETIRDRTGRVFHPLSPDYTSRVPALAFSRKALDLGRPLLMSYNSVRSNGRRVAADADYARQFVQEADAAALDALPISGLYSSSHNLVAYDLVSSAARCPGGSVPELDLRNLVRRAREDLATVAWADPAQRADQYARLEAAEARLGVTPTPLTTDARPSRTPRRIALEVLGRFPAAEQLVYRAARRPQRTVPVFESPIDAARAADRHYTGCALAS